MVQLFCAAVWFTRANVTFAGDEGSGGGTPVGCAGTKLPYEKLGELETSLKFIVDRPSYPNGTCWTGDCGGCTGVSGSMSLDIQDWTTESPLL
jgi:hypothetical protein